MTHGSCQHLCIPKRPLTTAFGVLIAALALFQFMSAERALGQESGKSTASVIRKLGYGGAIHHYKNFVLRGEEKHRAVAKTLLSEAHKELDSLAKSQELSDEQKLAVSTIRKTVTLYELKLEQVALLHGKGQTVEQIDEAVAIEDKDAIRALDSLRAGIPANSLEELEYHMGYGSGIHSFKNFILRADESYRAKASLGVSQALLVLRRFRDSTDTSPEQAAALDQIEGVLRAYEDALPRVQELIGQGKTAIEIDAVVKVDDAPALRGLAALRTK
jgi:methyl-accepting chemotaxis protein